MNDTTWLRADPIVERMELADASWVDVVRGLVPDADAVHDELIARMAWQQSKVFRYERWMDEPTGLSVSTGEPVGMAVRPGRHRDCILVGGIARRCRSPCSRRWCRCHRARGHL